MGLFGNKNKSDASAAPQSAPQNAPKPSKRAKKNELMKVLNESVWESVHEDFKANKQFILQKDGETRYVALLFDTNDVGGLVGKEAKKDESKGSVIEAIRSGRIKTFILPDMLQDDSFLIIPDIDTIDNMDEFAMFSSIKYLLCTVSPDGGVTTETVGGTDNDDDEDLFVTLEDIEKFIKNGDNVETLFPYMNGHGLPPAFGGNGPANAPMDDDIEELDDDDDYDDEDEDEDEPISGPVGPTPMGPVVNGPTPVGPSPIVGGPQQPVSPQQPVVNGPTPMGPQQPQPVQQPQPTQPTPTQAPMGTGGIDSLLSGNTPVDDEYSDDYDGMDDYDDDYDESMNDEGEGYSEEGEYNDDGDDYEDITEEVVNDFVIRNFYSDDLGLEVSTEPFDLQFLHGNAYVPFNEDRGSGWLNEYLSNLAKDANTRMERMHNENLFRMRERYMRIIQGHCENISKSLDISDDSTQYGKMRFAIEQNKTDNYDQIESSIADKRIQLENSWEAKLEQVGETAAAEAKQQYIDRHITAHENDLLNLETREKDEIERDYQNSMKRMNDDRRIEASKLLDLAINETLKEMSELYLKVLRDEKKEYTRLQNEMTRFIDDNRKDEKARIEAIAEQNRQVKQANEVRKEYTAKIKAMSAEFDVKKTTLQADIDRMKKEHDIELGNYEAAWKEKVDAEKAKNEDLHRQLDELMVKYADLDSAKKAEYEARINTFEQERASWKEELDHVVSVHNRSSKVTIFLIIAILLASMGIGFIFGTILNVRKTSEIEQSSLYKQSNSMITHKMILVPFP